MNRIIEIKGQSKSYLSFKIGEELFAVHVAHVNNIIEVPRITEIPDTPDFMKGVINLRGTVLPVIDTHIKFKMQPIKLTSLTCVLVLDINYENETMPIGALVDNVNEVLEIEKNQIILPPNINGLQSANVFIEGMVKMKDQFLILLNIDKLFAKDDINKIIEQLSDIKEITV